MKRRPDRALQIDLSGVPLKKRISGASSWERWLDEGDQLAKEIRSRLGRDVSVDDLLIQSRLDLECRTSAE